MFSSVFRVGLSGFEWAFFVFGCRKVDFSAFFDLERPRWPVAGPYECENRFLTRKFFRNRWVFFCFSVLLECFWSVSGCFRVVLEWFKSGLRVV